MPTKGVSGGKGRDERPQLELMLKAATKPETTARILAAANNDPNSARDGVCGSCCLSRISRATNQTAMSHSTRL